MAFGPVMARGGVTLRGHWLGTAIPWASVEGQGQRSPPNDWGVSASCFAIWLHVTRGDCGRCRSLVSHGGMCVLQRVFSPVLRAHAWPAAPDQRGAVTY